jgi:hypothetical protein
VLTEEEHNVRAFGCLLNRARSRSAQDMRCVVLVAAVCVLQKKLGKKGPQVVETRYTKSVPGAAQPAKAAAEQPPKAAEPKEEL